MMGIKQLRMAIVLLGCLATACQGQHPLSPYLGGWSGPLDRPNPFLFSVALTPSPTAGYTATFTGNTQSTAVALQAENGYLVGRFEDQLVVRLDTSTEVPVLFLQAGHHLCYVPLSMRADNTWVGEWDLLIGEDVAPTLYLSLDRQGGEFSASPYFKEPTFHYLWGQDFAYQEGAFEFVDIRSQIRFRGVLAESSIAMQLQFLGETAEVQLTPLPTDAWERGQARPEANATLAAPPAAFARLQQDILNGTLEGTHAVAVAQGGEMLYEQYFDGFTASTLHDTRSLSKTFAGSATGLAIQDGLLPNSEQPILGYFERDYPEINEAEEKEAITLHHLLTMSSGLDAIDFGLNRNSYANEGTYQSSDDWTWRIISAPMVYTPGTKAYYGSGSPHLVGPILDSVVQERLEFYLHHKLFGPLGMRHYRIQTNNRDMPYFGGGWYFNARDLIKFGQLYLNEGTWEDERLLPASWIAQSMAQHTVLENAQDKNAYGYLVWHKTYEVNEKKVASVEGRGSGGQYLFMVPAYDIVAVIFSGNYRNGKAFQPEKIMEEYILPALVE